MQFDALLFFMFFTPARSQHRRFIYRLLLFNT